MADITEIKLLRRFPRRVINQPVGVLYKGEYLINTSLEIGEGGMLIKVGKPLHVGQQLVLSFRMQKSDYIIVRGEIRYLKPNHQGLFSCGIQFIDPDPRNCRIIRIYVSKKTEKETILEEKRSII